MFAVPGFALGPTRDAIQVQNVAEKTFGTPTGATSWIMELVMSVNVGVGTDNWTTERLIDYVARTGWWSTTSAGPPAKIVGVLRQPQSPAIELVFGHAPRRGVVEATGRDLHQDGESGRLFRTGARASGTTCQAVASTTQGQVHETAILRSDYLIAARAQVVVPTHGTQGETLVFVRIGNVPVRTLK